MKHYLIYIIDVLLQSISLTVDEFRHTSEHIEKPNDTYSANSPVMILGDFNAHLSHVYGDKNPVKSNERGRVLELFLYERKLYQCQIKWKLQVQTTSK